MKKKIIALTLSTLMLVTLVACGNTKNTETAESTKNTESTSVTSEIVQSESSEATEESVVVDEHGHTHETEEISAEEIAAKNALAYEQLLTQNEYDTLTYSNYVTIGDYKTIIDSVTVEPTTDEEIQAEIDMYISYYTTYEEIKEGSPKKDDLISVELEVKAGDQIIEEISGYQLYIKLGEASLGTEFDEKILDAKVGEEITFKGTLPAEFETYGGQEVSFTALVHYIQGDEIIPEYNDEFVTTLTNGEHTNAEEFKEYIRNYISENKQYSAAYDTLDKIVEASTFTNIDSFVEAEYESTRKYYEDYAESMQVDFDTFISDYMGFTTKEEFEKTAKEAASNVVKQKFVVYEICNADGITISDDEYKEYADKFAVKYGYLSAAELIETEGAGHLRSYFLMEKLIKQYF